jgi:signal peptidase I
LSPAGAPSGAIEEQAPASSESAASLLGPGYDERSPALGARGDSDRELPSDWESKPQRRPLSVWLQLAAVGVLLYAALFHLSVVRGSSMSPSIHDGDRILIDPLSYLLQGIQRGDIVVMQYPLDPSIDYIKRVVGLPGDEIVIEDGEVWVNGELLSEPYVESPDPFCSLRTRVKPAHYFVLGDNRRRSCDSREFGQVPQGYVRGKVELCLWPPTRAGLIGA